jgi:RHS repeat-associated protein
VGARYDDDDNLTDHAGQTFVYDATGNLLSARGTYGQKHYTYDALERLIQEDHTPAGAPGADITKYGYLGDQRVTRLRPDGAVEVMVEGDGLDEHLVRVVKAPGSVAAPLYYHQDQMGSVAMITNGAGAVVEQYAYTAYGDQQVFAGANAPRATSAVGNVWGYQGHQVDTHTGLVQMRARWYLPALGRFTAPDPLGLLGGNNLLAFGFSAPTKYTDPFGLAATQPRPADEIHSTFFGRLVGGVVPGSLRRPPALTGDPLLDWANRPAAQLGRLRFGGLAVATGAPSAVFYGGVMLAGAAPLLAPAMRGAAAVAAEEATLMKFAAEFFAASRPGWVALGTALAAAPGQMAPGPPGVGGRAFGGAPRIWPTIGERPATNIVVQITENACGPACATTLQREAGVFTVGEPMSSDLFAAALESER